MIIEPKNYSTPESGQFIGTIIDVVDVGIKPTPWGDQHKIQIVWVLNATDAEGKPFRVMREPKVSLNEKSKLFETVRDVFAPQVLPPGNFDSEWLVGRSNRLWIKKEAPNSKGRVYANVIDISPLQQGDIPPQAPADFVRSQNRPVQVRPVQQQPRAVQFGAPQQSQPQVQVVASAPASPTAAQFPNAPIPPLQSLPVQQPSVFTPPVVPQQPKPVSF